MIGLPHHPAIVAGPSFVLVDDVEASGSGLGQILSRNGDYVLFQMPYSGPSMTDAQTAALHAAAVALGVDVGSLSVASLSKTDESVTLVIRAPAPSDVPAGASSSPDKADSNTPVDRQGDENSDQASTQPDGDTSNGGVSSLAGWVMIIPATVGPANIPLWDRSSDWAHTWITPQKVDNTWAIGVAGDSADVSNVTAAFLVGLPTYSDLQPISFIFNKYNPLYVDIAVFDMAKSSLKDYFFSSSGLVGSDEQSSSTNSDAAADSIAFVSSELSAGSSLTTLTGKAPVNGMIGGVSPSAGNTSGSMSTPQGNLAEETPNIVVNSTGQKEVIVQPGTAPYSVVSPGFSIQQ